MTTVDRSRSRVHAAYKELAACVIERVLTGHDEELLGGERDEMILG